MSARHPMSVLDYQGLTDPHGPCGVVWSLAHVPAEPSADRAVCGRDRSRRPCLEMVTRHRRAPCSPANETPKHTPTPARALPGINARPPRAAEALQRALEAVGLPAPGVAAIAARWRSPQPRRGTIVGVRCPARLGGRTPAERCRVRGGDQHWPARLLGALPPRAWSTRRRR